MDRGDFLIVTSTVTLLEVLVHPLRSNNRELATEYRDILLNSKQMTLEVSNAIAEQPAHLRAPHNIPTPAAIQITGGATGWGGTQQVDITVFQQTLSTPIYTFIDVYLPERHSLPMERLAMATRLVI